MDWQEIAIGLLTTAATVFGWFMRELWSAVQMLRKDLQELQNSLPSTYARRDDMKDMFDQLLTEIRQLRTDINHRDK